MQLDIELYREEVEVAPGVGISCIDVVPERPLRTMLLVHGFGGNARQWQHQIEAFSDRYRVIAPDLRGHGRSSRPDSGYDMGRMVRDLASLLDQLEVRQPCVLIGHSYGVALATELAWHDPGRFSHLILIAGAGEYRLNWYYKLAFRLPEKLLQSAQPLVANFVDASLPALQQMYFHNLRSWQGWEKFPQLRMPTLVLLGNRDRVLPQAAFERVAELVPPETSEVISVDVSAHMVMLERRDAVNRAIERFIEADTQPRQHSRWRERFDLSSRGSLLRERPWLAHYETTVPPTIHVPRQPITRLLDRAARRFPRRTALVFNGRKLSYRTVREAGLRLAHALRALGVEPGARVMLLLPNVPQFVMAYYGVLRAGGVVVLANPLGAASNLAEEARRTECRVLITLARFGETAAEVQAQAGLQHVILAEARDYLPCYLRLRTRRAPVARFDADATVYAWTRLLRDQPTEPPPVQLDATQTAAIIFTSGATGPSRGVMLSHHNLLANALQLRAWLTDARDGAETVLCVIPFSHAYGMTVAMNLAVCQGATMLLLTEFDARAVLETIRDYQPTYFPGVPAMYVALNNFPEVRKYNVQSVRACISGAAPLPIEVEEAFEKLTKGRLVEGYGLTESTAVTHASPIYGTDKVGSIGLPLPSTEARIVDLRTGRPLPPGEIGELLVRGPQVMQGYWQDEAATRAAIDAHGWLHTSDVARMDADGYFQLISRRQEMWKATGGNAAYPRDVEEVIYELPAVQEAVVVAIANQPVAFLRIREGASVSASTVIAYCERRLPPEQVPRLVLFVSDFPRNLIGKVLRRELVTQYAPQIRAEAGTVGLHLSGLTDTAAETEHP